MNPRTGWSFVVHAQACIVGCEFNSPVIVFSLITHFGSTAARIALPSMKGITRFDSLADADHSFVFHIMHGGFIET